MRTLDLSYDYRNIRHDNGEDHMEPTIKVWMWALEKAARKLKGHAAARAAAELARTRQAKAQRMADDAAPPLRAIAGSLLMAAGGPAAGQAPATEGPAVVETSAAEAAPSAPAPGAADPASVPEGANVAAEEANESEDDGAEPRATLRAALVIKRRRARRLSAISIAASTPGATGATLGSAWKHDHEVEGYLLKKSKLGRWQRRYFKTQSHYLLYSLKKGSDVLGGVDLAGEGSAVASFTARDGAECIRVSGLDGDDHGAPDGTACAPPTRKMELRRDASVEGSPTIAWWHTELLAAAAALRDTTAAMRAAEREFARINRPLPLCIKVRGHGSESIIALPATPACTSIGELRVIVIARLGGGGVVVLSGRDGPLADDDATLESVSLAKHSVSGHSVSVIHGDWSEAVAKADAEAAAMAEASAPAPAPAPAPACALASGTTASGIEHEGVRALIAKLFALVDLDSSGSLDRDEVLAMERKLAKALGRPFDEAACLALIAKADANEDCDITLEEYSAVIASHACGDDAGHIFSAHSAEEIERQIAYLSHWDAFESQLRTVFAMVDTDGDMHISALAANQLSAMLSKSIGLHRGHPSLPHPADTLVGADGLVSFGSYLDMWEKVNMSERW
jgi:hypothetical protein